MMSVTTPEGSTQAVATVTADLEGEIRELVAAETASPPTAPTTPTEAAPALNTDEIAPLVQKVAAASIEEFERLIGQLKEARSYLEAEGERIQRETMRYTALSRTASESVRIISDTVGEWRKAGHPVPAVTREDERLSAMAAELR
jgi:hypothetical protein